MPATARLLDVLGRIAPDDIGRAAREAAGSGAAENLVGAYADMGAALLSCAVDLVTRVASGERLSMLARQHGMWAGLMADPVSGSHASLQPPFAALGRVAEACGVGAHARAEAVRVMAGSLFTGADIISHTC